MLAKTISVRDRNEGGFLSERRVVLVQNEVIFSTLNYRLKKDKSNLSK